MNEQKHTQGPWQVELCRVYHNSGKGRRNIAICLASQKPPSDEYEVFEDIANARLIAAAPDMLEALESICTEISGGLCMNYTGSTGICPNAAKGKCAVWDAIQKAKGAKNEDR